MSNRNAKLLIDITRKGSSLKETRAIFFDITDMSRKEIEDIIGIELIYLKKEEFRKIISLERVNDE